MENNKDKAEDNIESLKYLKITNVRPYSVAQYNKLRENDVIIGLNSNFFNSSYENLRKVLDENDKENVITILRNEIFFNITIKSSLGVACEEVSENDIINFDKNNIEEFFKNNTNSYRYEIYKNMFKRGIVLKTSPSILPSIAPPFWMIYNKIWVLLFFTIIFYMILFFVSPWLFFISWILKSWYYGRNQIDILRNYYRFLDYRLYAVFCCENEENAQKKARELDPKIDFNYSYLDPPVEQDPVDDLQK